SLRIEQLSESTFRHVSYLQTNDFGKVACNGMVVIDSNEALVFDTPVNDEDSKELIDWIKNTLNSELVGVIITHFHNDCLGGLSEFHNRNIPSYATYSTIELATSDSSEIPKNGFENYQEIQVGRKKVINEYFGEGHTKDNIISYVPDEKVLFGGCLIKTLNASKGYLGDANTQEWSKTVKAVKSKYGAAEIIIPGHGKPGGIELLDYTIKLFEDK
ncbi:MAG: subclass B1 metallo-beta-lactamase, partial [Bacteroidia bacterium]